jgi:hypothetical protein
MPTVESIIEATDHLKPISDVAGKVLALLDDPDCGVSDLSDIIRHEPALTANLLKLANSAYFGLPGKLSMPNKPLCTWECPRSLIWFFWSVVLTVFPDLMKDTD